MNEIIYHDCPDCRGTGQQLHTELWPTGHKEIWKDCEFCDGNGSFEEDDFLVLRLEGKV